jgi:hypothetical protein
VAVAAGVRDGRSVAVGAGVTDVGLGSTVAKGVVVGRSVAVGSSAAAVGLGRIVSRAVGVGAGAEVEVGDAFGLGSRVAPGNGATSITGVGLIPSEGEGLVSTGGVLVRAGVRPATNVSAADVKISSWGVRTPSGGCSNAWQE